MDQIASNFLQEATSLLKLALEYDAEWKHNEEERRRQHDPDFYPDLSNLEDCVDLFIQSQQMRFPDDLFETADEHYYPDDRESANRCGSVAVEVDRDKLADEIEAEIPEQQALENAIALAHSEDIDAWVEVVQEIVTNQVSLSVLIQNSGLSVVQVWIAILFGGFAIKREGDFYEGDIFVWIAN